MSHLKNKILKAFESHTLMLWCTSLTITHFAGTLCPGLRRMISFLTRRETGTLVFSPSLIVHCSEMHGDNGE